MRLSPVDGVASRVKQGDSAWAMRTDGGCACGVRTSCKAAMDGSEMDSRRQDVTVTIDERLHIKILSCKKSKLYYYYILYSPIDI